MRYLGCGHCHNGYACHAGQPQWAHSELSLYHLCYLRYRALPPSLMASAPRLGEMGEGGQVGPQLPFLPPTGSAVNVGAGYNRDPEMQLALGVEIGG